MASSGGDNEIDIDDDDRDDDGLTNCCTRTYSNGRISCSLEAGFSAAFALLSFGAMLYANITCDYVVVTGNRYYNSDDATNNDPYDPYYAVTGADRGLFFGQPAHNVTCLSWISLDRLDDDKTFLNIDPWWYAAMGCAMAASLFGFAAILQIAFLSCFPRRSQRFAARCAAWLALLAAVLEGCTLLYLNSNAVNNVTWPYHEEVVDFTTYALHIGAWCAVGSLGGWLVTAFILFFLKNPRIEEPDDDENDNGFLGASSGHRSSKRSDRDETEHHDDEEMEDEEDIMEVTARQEEMAPAATTLRATETATGEDDFEDAVMMRQSASPRAQAQHVVDDAFDYEPGYSRRAPADEFCDG